MFLWVVNFRGLTAGFARLLTLSRTFIIGYICLTKNTGFFTRKGYLSLLAIPNTRIFHFLFLLCDRETHFWKFIPFTEPTQSNTKHSVDLPTMHSHPFNVMSPCICNARCHCMLYHVTWIMNATWTTQSTPLTDVMDNHITCI